MAATSASLLVVTVATDRRGRDANGQASRPPLSASDALTREQDLCGLAALRASCSAAGARLAVLGLDSPFVGFGDKIARTREFVSGALSCGEIEPDDAVVFTDGFDSFVARPAGGAARALLAATPPGSVLFSAERGCWPDAALAVRFPEPPRGALAAAGGGRYRYLNAGGYGGRARDVSALLEAVWSDALSATASGEGLAADDQLLFQRRLLAQHEAGLGSGLETECPAIELDYACQVFQANAGEDVDDASSEPVLQVDSGELLNALTGSRPALVHYNGGPRMRLGARRLLEQMPFWPPPPEPEPRSDDALVASHEAAVAATRAAAETRASAASQQLQQPPSSPAALDDIDDDESSEEDDHVGGGAMDAVDAGGVGEEPRKCGEVATTSASAATLGQEEHTQAQLVAEAAAPGPATAPAEPAQATTATKGVEEDKVTAILVHAAAAAEAEAETETDTGGGGGGDEDRRRGSWLYPSAAPQLPAEGGSSVPGFDPSADGETADAATEALLLAARRDDVAGIMAALEQGAEVDFEFGSRYGAPEGYTALMSACARGRLASARALLQAGADPNFVSSWGELVAFWAIDAGKEMIELLVEYGCDLDEISPRGWTALSYAAAAGEYSRSYAGVSGGPAAVLLDLGATRQGLGPPALLSQRVRPGEYLEVTLPAR